MVMAGYTPAAFAPMQATYQNWLQSRLGTAPLAQAYGASFRPYAELHIFLILYLGFPDFKNRVEPELSFPVLDLKEQE